MTVAFAVVISGTLYAQDRVFSDEVFHPAIRTVTLKHLTQDAALPVLVLNDPQPLILGFDDHDARVKNYRFTIIHCTAGWLPSDLWKTDYIEGFCDEAIINYRFSKNTLQPYVHYQAPVPSERMKLTKSGNYALLVYEDHNPDQPVFVRRFMVADPKVSVNGRIRIPAVGVERLKRQEIAAVVETSAFQIVDPLRNLHVIVMQNGRTDSQRALKPLMVRGNQIDYQLIDETNQFYAGNEFRTLDLRSVKNLTSSISEIIREAGGYVAWVWPDMRRHNKPYTTKFDMNGRFAIANRDGNDAETDAEYIRVHLALESETAIPGAEVFVLGGFNLWALNNNNRMRYDGARRVYEKSILLKQGVYDYQYAIVVKDGKEADTGFFEGNFAETGNEYILLVYYRQPGAKHDSLIGIRTFNSKDYL